LQIWLSLGIVCGLILLLYVVRGWRLSGIGLIGFADLLRAPFFVLWKLLLMLRMPRSPEWVRTRREHP